MHLKATGLTALLVAAWSMFTLSCSSGKSTAEAKGYRMGERVEVGPLIYNVMDTEWKEQLGEGPGARIPKNRFLMIHLSVTNSGVSDSAIPVMTLLDAGGQSFTELTDGQGVPEWLGYLRNLKPAQTDRGRVLFDVPPGAYRLRVTNDAEPGSQRAALIDIPFQVEPVLPPPPAR